MISLDRIRELESKLKDASDEDVLAIRQYLYGLGQLFYETWRDEQGSQIPVGLERLDEDA